MTLNIADRHNKLQQILSPNSEDEGVWIHQDAWFSMGTFDKDFSTDYTIKRAENGVYAMVVKGDFTINGQEMHARDGFGIWDVDSINITANSQDAEILVMDVPMEF
jgi:redox-sensitive bicupin YhaK (pirin superfamily)